MKKSIVKTFSSILVITMIAKVLGLLRDIVFAKYYGTEYIATAFFAAIRIPTQLLDIILGSSLIATFVPVFNEVMQKEGKDKANSFANNYINIVSVISTLLSVLGIIFAPQVVNILAGGFDEKTYILTVELIRIVFPTIIFTAIAFSFVGLLQSYGEFNIPAMISGISNIALILFLIFFREKFGIYGVAVFMIIAWSLQVIVQLPSAYKKGYRFKPYINFKDPNIKKILILAIPIIVSTAILPINNLVSMRLASGLGDSALPALEYSYKLYIVIAGIFTYAIGNIIFPELSRHVANNEKDKYISILNKSLRIMSYILIPITIGIMVYGKDMIRILYERGAFNETSTNITSIALLFYSIGIIGFGIVEVMNKSFYAKQDTKTPLKIGLAIVVVNIIFSILLSHLIGYSGLALATSLTAIINGIILSICANKENKGILSKELGVLILKVCVCSVVMGGAVYYINNLLINIFANSNLFNIIRMFIGGISGIVIYYLMSLILKIEESYVPIKLIKKS